MEFKIKFDEQMAVEAANRVLDEFEYNGKTIREWADALKHPKSNADRIRTMSDEELADWIETIAPSGTYQFWLNGKTWLQWLRQEEQP